MKWLGWPLWISRNSASSCPHAAAPLIHRIGIERGVLDELGVEAAQRIARFVDLLRATVGPRGQEIAIFGIEHEDEPHQDGEQPLIKMARPAYARDRE